MRLEFRVDGKTVMLDVNSNKPLSAILTEDLESEAVLARCGKGICGNCVVLMGEEHKAVLACLIPAFRVRDKEIQTFDSFRKTRNYRDIEKAYLDTNSRPCPKCYASKTLLIESVLQELEGVRPHIGNEWAGEHLVGAARRAKARDEQAEREATILQELSLNRCNCLDSSAILEIVEAAAQSRRKRGVRRN